MGFCGAEHFAEFLEIFAEHFAEPIGIFKSLLHNPQKTATRRFYAALPSRFCLGHSPGPKGPTTTAAANGHTTARPKPTRP